MTDPLPAPPSAVDVVPTEEFDELIARTQKDLARLEREHTIAEAAAIAAERSVSDVPDDPELTDWAEAQLDRFVAGLRAEHDAEMEAVLAAARDRAAACIERAEHEADLVLSYARATVDARSGAGSVGPAPVSGPVVWRRRCGRGRAHDGRPGAAVEPCSDPGTTHRDDCTGAGGERCRTAGSRDRRAGGERCGRGFAVRPERASECVPWTDLAADQDIAPAERPAADDPVKQAAPALVSTTGADGGGTPAGPDREFWKEPESQAPKRGLFKRLPMFAILQVVGVVIVLIVVLLRIG